MSATVTWSCNITNQTTTSTVGGPADIWTAVPEGVDKIARTAWKREIAVCYGAGIHHWVSF